MSGHNKWSKIKHTKGKTDAIRGKAFSKAAMDIITSVREGGTEDPALNARLRLAIEFAKKVNMPNDTIKRAIDRGAGKGEGAQIETAVYEGYAPGGVAMIIECLTDNRNRTASEVRSGLEKNGGNLGTPGSVSFMFAKKGTLEFLSATTTEEKLMEVLLDAGAEDIQNHDEIIEVLCAVPDFDKCVKAAEKAGIPVEKAELKMIPNITVELDDAGGEKLMSLIEKLEELNDVQNVYTNAA